MIKAVFFDFDGVLALDSNGLQKICENIQSSVPTLSLEKLMDCYCKYSIPLLTNGKSHKDVWADVCRCLGADIDVEVLMNALGEVRKNLQMYEFIRSLDQKYRIGIITDNFAERMKLLPPEMEMSLFDPIIISSELGVSKHDGTTNIYDHALKIVSYTPEEVCFIDNSQKNLDVPSHMGIHTYWHDDSKNDVRKLADTLNELGVS